VVESVAYGVIKAFSIVFIFVLLNALLHTSQINFTKNGKKMEKKWKRMEKNGKRRKTT
jgi:hypothetical protein